VGVFRLNSQTLNYDWGSPSAIAELLGRAPSGKPEAELWMGAHHLAPSKIAGSPNGVSDLRALIASDLIQFLGADVADQFGDLPFLLKVLAADTPLSLQAHPTTEQARLGFEREERAGTQLTAPTRNYKDRSHKPELILALSDFWALSGFRQPAESLALFRAFIPGARGMLGDLLCTFEQKQNEVGLQRFFQGLLGLPIEECSDAIALLNQRASRASLNGEPLRVAPWAQKLAQLHPNDPGVLASLLLHLIHLRPGEAMYLPAGNLHAYLFGLGIEIMASSDNVMRGGLTKKHLDIKELCSILRFEPFAPAIQSGVLQVFDGRRSTSYPTPAKEFDLSIVEAESFRLRTQGPEIWLVLDGYMTLSGLEGPLSRGEQVFLSSGVQCTCEGPVRFARARVADVLGSPDKI
jgi:mannose-6-phosphate isomerase